MTKKRRYCCSVEKFNYFIFPRHKAAAPLFELTIPIGKRHHMRAAGLESSVAAVAPTAAAVESNSIKNLFFV